MVLNPRIARRFAEALAQRSKTDPVDARALREYARRMEFVPWSPPASERLRLRALARRIAALVEMRTQEKNRLHAAQSSAEMKCITHDIEVSIRHFDRRIKALEKQAKILIDRHPQLQAPIARIISVKGIAFRSAIQVYGELCVLPKDMTARQWVAHAGLDPRHFESGAFQGKTRISKAGNKYLRAALYMPAFNAILHQANVKAFYTRLVGKGKKEMQATVAVMRKLLHAIHGMLKSDTDFEGRKFFALEA
jgi:transposase